MESPHRAPARPRESRQYQHRKRRADLRVGARAPRGPPRVRRACAQGEFDALVVGAAVTLVSSPGYSGAGMRFDLPFERWDEIDRPILFYGLSYRHWPGAAYAHADRLRSAIAYATASPRCLFSLRNDGTRDWLAREIGGDVSEVHVVPDPALYIPAQVARHPWTRDKERLQVAVSLNDEDWRARFAVPPNSPWEQVRRRVHPCVQVG